MIEHTWATQEATKVVFQRGKTINASERNGAGCHPQVAAGLPVGTKLGGV